ncbi:MAG: TetR/AcrR family transcriptional regulator [Rectinemataceae bacterium]
MARLRDEGMETRIIRSAMDVFGEQGFQATTLKDIAAGAGISTGSIYTYFKDKEALFQATVLYGWDSFNAELAALAASGAGREERLSLLLDKGFAALTQALPLLRGMLFDADKQHLVEPQLERVIASIDRLLSPGPERNAGGEAEASPFPSSAAEASETGRAQRPRQALIRILITGILFSAALGEPEGAADMLGNLRFAVVSFLRFVQNSDRSEPPAASVAKTDGGGSP